MEQCYKLMYKINFIYLLKRYLHMDDCQRTNKKPLNVLMILARTSSSPLNFSIHCNFCLSFNAIYKLHCYTMNTDTDEI